MPAKKTGAQLDREIADILARGEAFKRAQAEHRELDRESDAASEALRAFPRGPIGLVPDAVRMTSEYRAAKARFDRAFTKLRDFNAIFTKTYAKELREERAKRYANR